MRGTLYSTSLRSYDISNFPIINKYKEELDGTQTSLNDVIIYIEYQYHICIYKIKDKMLENVLS